MTVRCCVVLFRYVRTAAPAAVLTCSVLRGLCWDVGDRPLRSGSDPCLNA